MSNWHDDAFWEEVRWPAARNDHYCSQEFCRHAAIDLAAPHEGSVSEDDEQWPVSWGRRCRHWNDLDTINHSTLPLDQTVCDQEPTKTTLATVRELMSQNLRVRTELDDIQTSFAEQYFDLEERFITYVAKYSALSEKHDQLALKHDHLLNIMTNLCQELGVHADNLDELNAWKMVEQKVYTKEGRNVNYQLPSPAPTASTVNTVTETNIIDSDIYTDSTTSQNMGPISPLSPPNSPQRPSGTTLSESQAATSSVAVKRCHLVLRLPPRDEGGNSGSGQKDLKRKGAQKRKALSSGESGVQKRAKK